MSGAGFVKNKTKLSVQPGNWQDKIKPKVSLTQGLSVQVIKNISKLKQEPSWLFRERLRAWRTFKSMSLPKWGPDLSKLDFSKIHYYSNPVEKTESNWRQLPKAVKKTFDRLGVSKMEQDFLGGLVAQYDSEMVYHSLQEELKEQGIIFCSLDQAVKEYPGLVKKYFGTVVPRSDNKLAALNTAVWSGGSFIYVPPKVKALKPLQAYFRLNAKGLGQFERTLIIVDSASQMEYIEGCTAPYFNVDGLHAAVVEIIAAAGSKVRYTTIQNWPSNVYNLVTKRALLKRGAYLEWLDGNFGSKVTMKYPSLVLAGANAKGCVISLATARSGQVIEAGAKAIHLAPRTTSQIISKSLSFTKGRASWRGLIKINQAAANSRSRVLCQALLLDKKSQADSYPKLVVKNKSSVIEHEAAASRLSQTQVDYLQSRGFSEKQAVDLIINGFAAPLRRALPVEFAVELEKLLALEIVESVV